MLFAPVAQITSDFLNDLSTREPRCSMPQRLRSRKHGSWISTLHRQQRPIRPANHDRDNIGPPASVSCVKESSSLREEVVIIPGSLQVSPALTCRNSSPSAGRGSRSRGRRDPSQGDAVAMCVSRAAPQAQHGLYRHEAVPRSGALCNDDDCLEEELLSGCLIVVPRQELAAAPLASRPSCDSLLQMKRSFPQ